MSRIDEALKRASQGLLPGRSASRTSEAPLRLAEESTLNDYPPESRSGSVRLQRAAEASVDYAVAPAAPAEEKPAFRHAPGTRNLEASEKLMLGRMPNPLSKEQYRRLAATLHDAQMGSGLKTVMVTSAVPKEGKTLTVANLALTLSESYRRRVLLVDADLRRPSIHALFELRNERGLTDVLRVERMQPPVTQVTSHLSVLTSGKTDQNPLAGLTSERMRLFIEESASRYDWVLLDAPPVGLLSDAQLLRRMSQAAVFVIRAGATPYSVIERAISELGRDCIIGTVLNGVEEQSIPATGYYGEYYSQD